MTALRLLPPLGWTLVVAWLSSGEWSAAYTGATLLPLLRALFPWAAPEQLEAMHWLARKTGHVIEYAVLAGLWRGALVGRDGTRGWRAPLGLSILTAALDELHQATTRSRTGSPTDVLLDSVAAAAVLIALGGGTRRALTWLTTALLWIGAAGGTALIALNWTLAAPSGWLWWSAPLAWIMLLLWHRTRGRA